MQRKGKDMPLFNHLQSLMQSASGSAATIISVSLMLFAGFAMTRITRLAKLPNVTAYIVAGILIGPYCLNAIPGEIVSGMDFLSDIALAFIAFSTGEFFRVSVLKKNGLKVIVITVLEACMASVLVYLLMNMRPGAGWGDLHCVGGAGGGHGPGLHHDDHPADGRSWRFREHSGAGGGAGRRGGPGGIRRCHSPWPWCWLGRAARFRRRIRASAHCRQSGRIGLEACSGFC